MLTQVCTTSAPRPGFDNEVHGLSRSQRTAILGSIDQHSRSGEEDGQSRIVLPGRSPIFAPANSYETSSFTAAFRKETGSTSTAYHESLDKSGGRNDTPLDCHSDCDRRDLRLCLCASWWDGHTFPHFWDGCHLASRDEHLRGVFAPTGIPLGAAPLTTPGVSSGSSVGACSPTSTVTANAMNSTALFSGNGIDVFGATTTGTVPMSSNTGLSSNMCGQAPAAGSTTSSQSNATSSNGTSQLGVPTIPMGSTELSNPGLSPAPCPATGNAALSTSSSAC